MNNLSDYSFQTSIKRTYLIAQKIVPLLIEIFGVPESVVDLGGGGGGWLKVFQEKGTKKILCIDTPLIKPKDLVISYEEFMPFDLSSNLPEPIKYDFCISTEFAEHVSLNMSEKIVDFLTQSSSVILFSAGIPGQGGGGHINEQRPIFWEKLFEDKGYKKWDFIREKILFDDTIPFWFRQNLYLYVDKNYIKEHNLEIKNSFIPDDFELIHESILNRSLGFSDVLKELIPSFQRMINNRFLTNKTNK